MKSKTAGILLVLALSFPVNCSAAVVNEQVKKVAAFLFADTPAGPTPLGTGFIVAINESSHTFNYLITTKHVIEDDNGVRLPRFHARLNHKTSDSVLITFELKGPMASQQFYHSDSSVDLVALAFLPPVGDLDILSLPLDMLASHEKIKAEGIREGDEMLFAGLFTPFIGRKRNYPIVRFGRLAMLPGERIPFGRDGKNRVDRDLLLMETFAFGGNSGAPVFYYLSGSRFPGVFSGEGGELLAGVMMGYFGELNYIEEVKISSLAAKGNMGIAAVIPAHLIRELLLSPNAAEWRRMVLKRWKR
jgi:hypothetical protein